VTDRLGSTVSVSTCVVVCVRVVKAVDKGGLPKIEAMIPGAFSAVEVPVVGLRFSTLVNEAVNDAYEPVPSRIEAMRPPTLEPGRPTTAESPALVLESGTPVLFDEGKAVVVT